MIRIVNRKTHTPTPLDVPIHRPNLLGNPFPVAEHGRTRSIELYTDWLHGRVAEKHPLIIGELNRIVSLAKVGDVCLVCCCKPYRCHGEVVRELIYERMREGLKEVEVPILFPDAMVRDILVAAGNDPDEIDPDLNSDTASEYSKKKNAVLGIMREYGVDVVGPF